MENATSGQAAAVPVIRSLAPAQAGAAHAELRRAGALVLGWDDEDSRGNFTIKLRKSTWRDGIDRISLDPASPGSRWGVALKGKDREGREIHVVACADLMTPPAGPWQAQLGTKLETHDESGPWQYLVPYADGPHTALLINDVLSA